MNDGKREREREEWRKEESDVQKTGKDGKEKIATVEGMDGELIEKVKIAFKAFGGGTEFKSNAYEGETSLRGLPILPNRQNRRNIDSFD